MILLSFICHRSSIYRLGCWTLEFQHRISTLDVYVYMHMKILNHTLCTHHISTKNAVAGVVKNILSNQTMTQSRRHWRSKVYPQPRALGATSIWSSRHVLLRRQRNALVAGLFWQSCIAHHNEKKKTKQQQKQLTTKLYSQW